MHCPGHLVNLIVLFFQLTFGLCFTSQSCFRNIFIPSKSITAASSVSLCPLISISSSATLVTSPFFILSALNTSKEKFISFIWILFFLTSCLLIPVCVHPESTSAFTFNFLLFFVLTFTCTFSSFFPSLLQWFRIIYSFWDFIWEISYTVPTWDLHQNPALLSCHLCHLILLEPFSSLLSAFLCSIWQYVLPCHI